MSDDGKEQKCEMLHTGDCNCPKRETITIERDLPELSYDIVEGNLKHLQGQVLTFIEAVIPERNQAVAAKSVIKGFFNDKLTLLFDLYGFTSDKEIPDYVSDSIEDHSE